MKNRITFLVAMSLLLLMVACQKTYTDYAINGTISGLAEGTVIELVPGATHSDEKAIATCELKEGKFTFSGTLDEPRLFNLKVENTYGQLPVMMENGRVDMSAVAEVSDMNGNSFVKFSDVNISGSSVHDIYSLKMAYKDSLNQKYEDYHNENSQVLEALEKARLKGDKEEQDSIRESDAFKIFEEAEKNFFTEVETTIDNTVLANKDSFWGPLVMLQSMSYFTKEQEELYEQFSEQAKESYYGQIVRDELYPKSLVGKQMPDFTLPDRDRVENASAQLVKGKKYVLIDFWASWCAPCRKEIPNLKRIYKEFSSRGLEIISISIDKKEADWLKALDEEQLPWPNMWDNKSVDDLFLVKMIPSLFIVDEQGMVLADDLKGEELYQKLQELLD